MIKPEKNVWPKKFLKKFTLSNFVVGKKLEKNFPLISAVGQGADDLKKPIFCEFKFNKKTILFDW